MQAELALNMIKRADKDHLPEDHDMRKLAIAFDEARDGYFSEKQSCDVKGFMSAWARARACWCEYTGEPLI